MTAHPRLSFVQALGRKSLKRLLYGQLSMRSAARIAVGREAPLVRFTVEASPPSIYLNFTLDQSKVEALARALDLPEALPICPVRCLADDTPRYVLTLNFYRVSGLVEGLRAEWSVYVRDASSKPRYLIIEARSNVGSMDPVSIVTQADLVEHAVRDGRVRTRIESEGSTFAASLPVPDASRMARASIAAEWVEANDIIYWRNGVADRVYYGGSLANPEAVVLPVETADLQDQTPWRPYLADAPVQAVAFTSEIDLVLSPWCNL